MNGATVFLTAIGYVSSLFLIAWWGDGAGRRFLFGRLRAVVYALSLAVYCTSWTYYGSVGLASAHGLDFLPIYIGPILVIGARSAVHRPRRQSCPRAERHHGRRFRIRAVREIPAGRRSRRAHR
jgi:Na+/proline symporter